MERCPNCGTSGRQDAKFCTTCGLQFDDENNGEALSEAGNVPNDTGGAVDGDVNDGWPPSAIAREPAPTIWERNAAMADRGSADESAPDQPESSSFWPEPALEPWPAPPRAISDATLADAAPMATPELIEQGQNPGSEASENDGMDDGARGYQLLDELRAVLDAMASRSGVDLGGVIAELEVAVTPPGALPPEEVAELREALLVARERPRDVDTIVDLTKRVEAMVSLSIAYDRAIAAIERTLVVLRNDDERVSG